MKVGRFQVMAILQAARAKELGLPDRRAKSWGLNRAIFYAAAKRGFKHETHAPPSGRGPIGKVATVGKEYLLGNELAYTMKRSGRIYFIIGGKPQTETDFARQIAARFGKHFEEALKESLSIIHLYPNEVLLSPEPFFQRGLSSAT